MNDDSGLTLGCLSIRVRCHISQGCGACWEDFVNEVLSWCDCYSRRRLIRLWISEKYGYVSRVGTGRKTDDHVVWTRDPRIRVNCFINKINNSLRVDLSIGNLEGSSKVKD